MGKSTTGMVNNGSEMLTYWFFSPPGFAPTGAPRSLSGVSAFTTRFGSLSLKNSVTLGDIEAYQRPGYLCSSTETAYIFDEPSKLCSAVVMLPKLELVVLDCLDHRALKRLQMHRDTGVTSLSPCTQPSSSRHLRSGCKCIQCLYNRKNAEDIVLQIAFLNGLSHAT